MSAVCICGGHCLSPCVEIVMAGFVTRLRPYPFRKLEAYVIVYLGIQRKRADSAWTGIQNAHVHVSQLTTTPAILRLPHNRLRLQRSIQPPNLCTTLVKLHCNHHGHHSHRSFSEYAGRQIRHRLLRQQAHATDPDSLGEIWRQKLVGNQVLGWSRRLTPTLRFRIYGRVGESRGDEECLFWARSQGGYGRYCELQQQRGGFPHRRGSALDGVYKAKDGLRSGFGSRTRFLVASK